MHRTYVDSVKRPFIPMSAVTEVKLFTTTVPLHSSQMAPPEEQQSVAGFGGWRDAAVPVWLCKQLWGLICPTPPQKRGCNSISSWPTVLPFAGTAVQALLKKPHWGNAPASAPLSKRHAGCATPRALVLFFWSCFPLTDPVSFSSLSQSSHKLRRKCSKRLRGREVISGRFAVAQN